MRLLLRFSSLVDRTMDRVGSFVGVLTLVMVLVGVWNTLARHLSKRAGVPLTSNGLIEAQWYLFTLIFLLGAAYTLRRNEHVRVDVLQSRFSPRARAWLDLLGTLFLLIPFAVAMIAFTWPGVARSFEVRESSPDPGGLPRYPIKAAVPLAFLLLILQGLSEIVKAIAALRGAGPTEGARDGPREGGGDGV